MSIQHSKNEKNGEFFILDERGEKIAKLAYFFENEHTINANHTYVSEVLRGQGIADKLFNELVSFVRKNNLTLVPSCSYIARKWQRENR